MTPTELRHLKINSVAQAVGYWVIGFGLCVLATGLFDLNLWVQVAIEMPVWIVSLRPWNRYRRARLEYLAMEAI
jgi:hypothetical protein